MNTMLEETMKPSLLIGLGLIVVACFGLSCNVSPDATSSTIKGAPTEADVEKFITKKEEALATGTGSAHKSVKLTFESIRFGKSRKATERDRVVNGIQGSTVYPARVKYISHRTWGNGEAEDKKIHYDYELYQDEYDEWNAYLVGPVN